MFNAHDSLSTIEDVLRKNLKEVDLIGELNLTDEQVKIIGEKIKIASEDVENFDFFCTWFKASLVTFFVFTGVYHYGSGGIWAHVSNYLQAKHIEYFKNNLFNILKSFNKPTFEDVENTYRYIGPIICHGLISQYSLDDYFDALHDTLYDTDYMGEYGVEEFRNTMGYRIHKFVLRYFNYLGDKANAVFNIYRELMLKADNSEISLEEALDEFGTQIPHRIISYYWEWKEQDKTKAKIYKQKKFRLVSPKVKLDVEGIGIYIVLPEQRIEECEDYKIEWHLIYEDRQEEVISADLYHKSNYYLSEELLVHLLPADSYTINLFCEGEVISTWYIQGLSKSYLCFDKRNFLVKKDFLPAEEVTFVTYKKHRISLENHLFEQVSSVPNWKDYNIFVIDLSGKDALIIEEESKEVFRIGVRVDRQVSLTGGEYLFGEDNDDNEIYKIFTLLPAVKIEVRDSEEWFFHVKRQTCQPFTISLKELTTVRNHTSNSIQVSLQSEQIIPKGQFGEYEIKVYNRMGFSTKFHICYSPLVECFLDLTSTLPVETNGRQNSDLYFVHSKNVSLSFEKAEYKGRVIYNNKMSEKYTTKTGEQFLYGTLFYTNDSYKFQIPIRKQIRPISWGWIGLGAEKQLKINWDTKWRKISIADLEKSTDVYLIIQSSNFGYEFVQIDIVLCNSRKNVYQQDSFKVNNQKNLRIPMNKFLTTIKSKEKENLYISLFVKNPLGEDITHFLLAKFQEDLVYEDLRHTEQASGLLFQWKEESSLIDREIVFYNLFYPWEEPIKKTIKDNQKLLLLDTSEFSSSLYGAKIQYQDEGVFFEEESFHIPMIKSLKVLKIGDFPLRNLEPLEIHLLSILKSFWTKRSKDFDVTKLPLEISDKEIVSLCISYLCIFKNRAIYSSQDRHKFINLFRNLAARYSKGENKYRILKLIISLNFEEKEFNELVELFQLLYLQYSSNSYFSLTERQYLWERHSYLGFLVDIRNEPKDRRRAVDRICNWVGDSVLAELVNEKNWFKKCTYNKELDENGSLRTCMEKSLWHKCSCEYLKVRIDEYTVGSINQMHELFLQFSGQNKNMDDQLDGELEKTQGIKVFQKTYVHTLVKFNQLNLANVAKDKPLAKLSDETRELESIIQKNLEFFFKSTQQHRKVYESLWKRRDIEDEHELPYYSGLLAYLHAALASKKYDIAVPEYLVGKVVSKFYRYYKDLFLRDALIFELFLILGGMHDES